MLATTEPPQLFPSQYIMKLPELSLESEGGANNIEGEEIPDGQGGWLRIRKIKISP